MESLFTQLIEVLSQQHQLVQQMNRAAQQQGLALGENDTTALNKALKELEKLTLTMAQLDPQREALQAKLAQQLGLAADSTLTALLPYAPKAAKPQLTDLQGQLQDQFRQLQNHNETNKILTHRSMQITSAVLKIFKGSNQTYQPGGQRQTKDPAAQLLNKQV